MSARTSIVKAIAEKLKTIDGSTGFNTNLFNNVFPKLKFWDEVSDFPCIYMAPGTELREYQPGGFKWGFLNVCIKCYVKDAEESAELLEALLEDVEKVLDGTLGVIAYDGNRTTQEISITSITTDEGLLVPYGVGEINLLVRYDVL